MLFHGIGHLDKNSGKKAHASFFKNSNPLPVNEKRFWSPVDDVFLHFGNVVWDVVDHMHIQVIRRHVEHLAESLTPGMVTNSILKPFKGPRTMDGRELLEESNEDCPSQGQGHYTGSSLGFPHNSITYFTKIKMVRIALMARPDGPKMSLTSGSPRQSWPRQPFRSSNPGPETFQTKVSQKMKHYKVVRCCKFSLLVVW